MDATVREMDDSTFLEAILIENLQRLDPDPKAEAQLVAHLVAQGATADTVSARCGKPASWTARRMRLLKVEPSVLKRWIKGTENGNSIAHFSVEMMELVGSLPPELQTRLVKDWEFCRSVNRKQLEVRFNLPRSLASLESRMVERVQESVSRGQVSGGVVVRISESLRQKSLRVDRHLAAAYVTELRRTARVLNLPDDLAASLLVGLPEVVSYSGADQDAEHVWPVLQKALRAAIKQLIAMREREGASLAADLQRRLRKLEGYLGQIRREAPDVPRRYRQVLQARLKQAGVTINPTDPSLLKELAVFADKSDISEEITRLESHFKQAYGLLKSAEPAGRTLDFLAQEMFREINTIGSKANEVRITNQVIRFKTELERIREQVQNIE
jgi:uncharacterized protein (TIGR00255 family)